MPLLSKVLRVRGTDTLGPDGSSFLRGKQQQQQQHLGRYPESSGSIAGSQKHQKIHNKGKLEICSLDGLLKSSELRFASL